MVAGSGRSFRVRLLTFPDGPLGGEIGPGGSVMECKHAQSLIPQYIADRLSPRELEEFIRHVEKCPECYDELETYFIVYEVTQQLDDQAENTVLDFKTLLAQDIRKSRRYIHKKRGMQFAAGMLILMLTGALIVFLIFLIAELGIFA